MIWFIYALSRFKAVKFVVGWLIFATILYFTFEAMR